MNFRQLHESTSLHLERQHSVNPGGASLPGTPGAEGEGGAGDGLAGGLLSAQDADLFGAFSSITLHYDGES